MGAEVLKLPYADSSIVMYVFLPNKTANFDAFVAEMANVNRAKVGCHLRWGNVHVSLPKLSLEESYCLRGVIFELYFYILFLIDKLEIAI